MKIEMKKTLKEYAKDAAERLKKSKSGSSPPKTDVKKSLKSAPKGPTKKDTKKT